MTLRRPLVVLAVAFGVAALPAAGHADPVGPLVGFTARTIDGAGDPYNLAGGHPDRLRMTVTADASQGNNSKDVVFDFPPGFAGDPHAVSTCPRELLSAYNVGTCPSDSQVGTATLDVGLTQLTVAVYRTKPDPGVLAEFGFKVSSLLGGRLFARALPDGRVRFEMHDTVQDAPIRNLTVELWGVPADHQTAPTSSRRPFLTMPTRCDGAPPVVTMQMNSWQAPEVQQSLGAELSPALEGCGSLEFDPRLDFALDNPTVDSPTGTRVSMTIPQSADPDGRDTARVAEVGVDLPPGMALSPSAANGLTACSEEEARIGETGPASCPASSRIGSVEISSPLLDELVDGAIYIGAQQSATDYRLYLAASGPGIDVKLEATLHADPETGQLSTRLTGLPELPVDRLTLAFADGPRAPLVTPLTCGSQSASATLTPYGGGPAVTASDVVTIGADPTGGPCPASFPFAPAFVAGTSPARAGAGSRLAMTIRRADREQLLDHFDMTLPPGLSARLASVARCAAAAAAAGACPADTRIGSATTETGSGPTPFALDGDVFLTGPYRQAPFGMALVFRAVAGPFDLGTIVIRAAMRIDSRTGQVTVESDPLPRIVNGIPLRVQTVALDVDRPGFMVNPTSCAPAVVTAAITSTGNAVTRPKSRFAVGGCRALRFRPRLTMALTDRSQLRANGHPGLRFRMLPTPRGANVRELDVLLPKLLGPSPAGPTAICSLRQAKRERCPETSKVGRALGRTPLLSMPLRGPLYVVQPPDDGPPDVWAQLRGMGISMSFRMKVAQADGRLRGTFADLPDFPLSDFELRFDGGKYGMFAIAANPCARARARRPIASADLTAHSAATHSLRTRVRLPGGC